MQPICSTTFLQVILTPGSGQAVQTGASATGASEPGQKSFPSTGEGTTLIEGGSEQDERQSCSEVQRTNTELGQPGHAAPSLGTLLPHWAHALEQCAPAL